MISLVWHSLSAAIAKPEKDCSNHRAPVTKSVGMRGGQRNVDPQDRPERIIDAGNSLPPNMGNGHRSYLKRLGEYFEMVHVR